MADLKITQLTQDTAPTSDDLVVTVDAPATLPTDKKVAISDLFSIFPTMTMARQAIINAGFDISQRNGLLFSSANPISGTYLIDRWQVALVNTGTLPTTITHSQQAHTPGDIPSAYYFYRIAPNGAGSGFGTSDLYRLIQHIENGTRFLCGASKKVTVSFWAKSSIANKKLGLAAFQRYGSGGSPTVDETLAGTSFTLTSSWVKYSYTFTTNTLVAKTFGTNNNDELEIDFAVMWGTTNGTNYFGGAAASDFGASGNIDISQVQVVAGDTALPFQPKSLDIELASCKRYYRQIDGLIDIYPTSNQTTTAAFANFTLDIEMRTTPTLLTSTITSTNFQIISGNNSFNISAIALGNATSRGGALQITMATATAGQAGFLRIAASNWLAFSAEL